MVGLLDVDEAGRTRLVRELSPVAVGLSDLSGQFGGAPLESVEDDLLSSFDSWSSRGFGPAGPGPSGRAEG
jgi:hypothetical protein